MYSFRFDLNEILTYPKSNENSIISSFYFIMGNKEEIYFRTYKKFQETLANFGGVSKTLLMFSSILNFLINDYTINKDINYHYFSIKREESNKRSNINLNHYVDDKNNANNWDRSSAIKLYYQKPFKTNFTLTPTHRKQLFFNLNLSDNVNNINSVKNKIKGDFNFKIYIISLFNSKTAWARRLKLIRKIWKNKISEENILLLSI